MTTKPRTLRSAVSRTIDAGIDFAVALFQTLVILVILSLVLAWGDHDNRITALEAMECVP